MHVKVVFNQETHAFRDRCLPRVTQRQSVESAEMQTLQRRVRIPLCVLRRRFTIPFWKQLVYVAVRTG